MTQEQLREDIILQATLPGSPYFLLNNDQRIQFWKDLIGDIESRITEITNSPSTTM
jgi:hypothetical protein